MRISTITNWAYGVTLLLTGLSGAAFMAAGAAADAERAAVETHLTYAAAAEDLARGAAALTDAARLAAIRNDPRHMADWRRERTIVRQRDRALQRVRVLDAANAERAAIAEAERRLAELDRIQAAGVAAAVAGDTAQARTLLFGADHERALAVVEGGLDHFAALVTARTSLELRAAQRRCDDARQLAQVMLGLTALVFLGVLYFVLRRRVSRPLARLTGVVLRLARQDFAVLVPATPRRDEIGDITDAVRVFRDNGLERERLEAEREADRRLKGAVLQMTHRLQACQTCEELAEVVACFVPQTFPGFAGRLYLADQARNAFIEAAAWRDPTSAAPSFPPTACWGVRRGRAHARTADGHEIACPHLGESARPSLCVPLAAQGDTIGLIYLEAEDGSLLPEPSRQFLDLLCDHVALALANLRLRARLASLAERDGLTGLFNRRRLDEALAGLAPDAQVAAIMADVDHFKRFNDDFGHDAGDAVLQHIARILEQTACEAGATAYRFGGEEFVVLIPDADIEVGRDLAERIRTRAAAGAFTHLGRALGHITLSLGVAAAAQSIPPRNLIRCADAALLEAKAAGRDRTILAGSPLEPDGDRAAA